MAHEIYENDKITAIESTWHGLETIVDKINLENSGLDWLVTSKPMSFVHNGENNVVDGYQAIVRQDSGLVLNVAKDSYAIIQNHQIFDLIDNALEGVNYKINTAGSLFNCKKVFVSVQLEEKQDYLINGEAFKNYLTFTTSHDATLPFCVYDTSVRVVCNNTLKMSWADSRNGMVALRVMHTKNSNLHIASMHEKLDAIFQKRDEFYENYANLMLEKIDEKTAKNVLTGWMTPAKDVSTRTKNQIENVVDLFHSGAGNKGETKADLLNAVTEYYTHDANSNDAIKNLQSNEFGAYGDKKMAFSEVIFDDEALNKLAERGEKLLELQAA